MLYEKINEYILNKNEKPHGGGGKIVEMLYDQSI